MNTLLLYFRNALLVLVLGAGVLVYAQPSQLPPEGNTAPPVNVSGTAQAKLGGLGVDALVVQGGTKLGVLSDGFVCNASTLGTIFYKEGSLNMCTDIEKINAAGNIENNNASGSDTDWTENNGNVVRESGNVGIGNTTPTKALDVTGDINFTGDLYSSGALVDLSGSGGGGGSGVSAGTVVAFAGSSCPAGFILADGSSVKASQYPDLHAVVGSKVPDLRGEFIRGLDNGRGVDSGRELGTSQSDAIQNIVGTINAAIPLEYAHGEYASGAFDYKYQRDDTPKLTGRTDGQVVSFDASRVVRTANETRPRNVALNYCIAAINGAGNTEANNAPNSGSDTDWTENNGNVVRESGNVGIGNTTPTKALDVTGDINFTGDLYSSGVLVDLSGSGGGGDITLIGTSLVAAHAGPGGGGRREGTESTLFNNFLGAFAGYHNTTGKFNNFLGALAGNNNTTGIYNNFLGAHAGYSNTTGDSNNFLGSHAGSSNTTGRFNNFLGALAGNNNTTGIDNNFLGSQAGLSNTTGRNNNFLGSFAGYHNTTGIDNNFLGYNAGARNTTGSNNIGIGRRSGTDTASSQSSGNEITNNSIFLGSYARPNASDETNQIVIGHDAVGAGSNTATIGNSSMTRIGGQVGWSASSDRRLKTEISDLALGLDFITQLRPVRYERAQAPGAEEFGFIAQEVDRLVQDLGYTQAGLVQGEASETEYLSLRYTELIAPLVRAVQEQQSYIELLEARMLRLEDAL